MPRFRMSRLALKLVLSLGSSGLFLWLAFRNVDITRAWQQMSQVRPAYVLGYLGCMVLIQLVRIYRWELLIRPFAVLSSKASFRISALGLMLILIMPLRLGELARPYLVKQETGAPMSSSLGAAAVERTIDGLLVTLLFFLTTLTLPAQYELPATVKAGGLGSLILFSSATLVIVAALVAKERVVGLLRTLGNLVSVRFTEKVLALLEAFIDGFRSLPNARSVLGVLACTGVYWFANGLGYYLIMLAFGWDLPLGAPFLVISILVIAIMIPAAPGFLGTFQGAILVGLAIFGVDATASAAYGLVVYPLTVLVVLAFGVPFMFTGGSAVRGIMATGSEELKP